MAANSKRKRELLVDFYRLSKRTDEVVVALRRQFPTVGAFDAETPLIMSEWRRIDRAANEPALRRRLSRLRACLFPHAPKKKNRPTAAAMSARREAASAGVAAGSVTSKPRAPPKTRDAPPAAEQAPVTAAPAAAARPGATRTHAPSAMTPAGLGATQHGVRTQADELHLLSLRVVAAERLLGSLASQRAVLMANTGDQPTAATSANPVAAVFSGGVYTTLAGDQLGKQVQVIETSQVVATPGLGRWDYRQGQPMHSGMSFLRVTASVAAPVAVVDRRTRELIAYVAQLSPDALTRVAAASGTECPWAAASCLDTFMKRADVPHLVREAVEPPRLTSDERRRTSFKTVLLAHSANPGVARATGSMTGPTVAFNMAATTTTMGIVRTVLAEANTLFQAALPWAYDAQTVLTACVSKDVRGVLGWAARAWSSSELSRNLAVAAHCDRADVPGTYDVVVVLGVPGTAGEVFKGGNQLLLQRGVELVCSPGTVIIANYARDLHAVTRIERPGEATRLVVIGFNNNKAVEAGWRAATGLGNTVAMGTM